MKSSTENSRREVEKCSVHRSGSSAHERVCRGRLVSRKACSAHGRVCRGRLVSRKACSAHGTHTGLVVSKKADLAHEVFTRSKVVCKKGANHARRSRVCRRRFNVLGQDWSSALRISAARVGETSLDRSSRGAAAMRATEP